MIDHKPVMKTIQWIDMDTGEPVATTEYPRYQMRYSPCPKCGKATTYNESQIDQDTMGNDIDGWAYECWDCHIMSDPVEI